MIDWRVVPWLRKVSHFFMCTERPRKIDLIPHGIPDVPLQTNYYKDKFGAEVICPLTFGLLSPNKGIEHVLGIATA